MVSDAPRVQKAKKNEISINQQKVFFFIGAFQYTSVSVGKGGSSPVFFKIGLVFFVFFFEKKTENCNFVAVLGFWKKAGFSLVGIQKYWELFFYWAELVSLNFTNFFAEFWLTAVYWVPPSNMVFQAYCLTFFFFFKTENRNFGAVLGFWKKAGFRWWESRK